jgi:hypothetical protein
MGAATDCALAAQATNCRTYGSAMRSVLKPRVDALRALEREAADRLVGLDTHTFDYLIGRVRAVIEDLSDSKRLKFEIPVKSCVDNVEQTRQQCAVAAQALLRVLELIAVEPRDGSGDKDARQNYAAMMPTCERPFGLKPVPTGLRATD